MRHFLENDLQGMQKQLAAKTAECETLRQKLETNKSSPATQTARPRITPTKTILLLGSSIIRDLRSTKRLKRSYLLFVETTVQLR